MRLATFGLKINGTKSSNCCDELEYLGYLINQKGVRPTLKKAKAISKIAPPTTRKQLRSCIGMVDYYRDMWPKQSHFICSFSYPNCSQDKVEVKAGVPRIYTTSHPRTGQEAATSRT